MRSTGLARTLLLVLLVGRSGPVALGEGFPGEIVSWTPAEDRPVFQGAGGEAWDRAATPDEILAEVNAQLGKTQRLAALRLIDELPRSAIGKVLKRELRERFGSAA